MIGFVSPVSSYTQTTSRARQRASNLGLGINFAAAAACPHNQISVLPKPELVFDEEVASPVREIMTAVPEYPSAPELCLMVAYGYWDNATRASFYDLYLHEARIAQFEAFQSQRNDLPVDAVSENSDEVTVFFSREDRAEPAAYHLAKEVAREKEAQYETALIQRQVGAATFTTPHNQPKPSPLTLKPKRKPVPATPVAVDTALEESAQDVEMDLGMEFELDEFFDVDLSSPIALSPVATSIFAKALIAIPSPAPSATLPSASFVTKTTSISTSSLANRFNLTITIPPLAQLQVQLAHEKVDGSERQHKRNRAADLSPSMSSSFLRLSSISPTQIPPAPRPPHKVLPEFSPQDWPSSPPVTRMSSPESSPAPSTPGDDVQITLGKRKYVDSEDRQFNISALRTNLNTITRANGYARKTRIARRAGRVYLK